MSHHHLDYNVFSWNFRESTETFITEKLAQDNCEYFTNSVATLPMKLICYCPTIFSHLRKLDQRNSTSPGTSFHLSMNAQKNISKIYKNTQSDGGRSGQFFYFTFDNKFILKTITNKELAVLRQRIEPYYNHFRFNNDSLIVKLYGVYTSINTETQE